MGKTESAKPAKPWGSWQEFRADIEKQIAGKREPRTIIGIQSRWDDIEKAVKEEERKAQHESKPNSNGRNRPRRRPART